MAYSILTIIIPTLNEEENIGRLIDRIQELLPKVRIIVVDDGSTDKTHDIVNSKNEEVQLINRANAEIKGLSASIYDGIKACNTERFMVIDGDFQHPPEALLEAISCFNNGADLVIGYRIKVEEWPWMRKLMSWVAQTLGVISLLLRRRQIPKDLMSGYFGGKTSSIEPLLDEDKIALRGYKILFDILKVLPRDYQILQFGYIFKNREHGDSKIGKTQIIEYFKSLF